MASIEDLKRNEPISVSIGGQVANPDQPRATSPIGRKTVIEHKKKKAPAPTIKAPEPEEEEEYVEVENENTEYDINENEEEVEYEEESIEDEIPEATNENLKYVNGLEDIGTRYDEGEYNGDRKAEEEANEIDEADSYMEDNSYSFDEDESKEVIVSTDTYDKDAEEIEDDTYGVEDTLDSENIDEDEVDEAVLAHLKEQITEKIKPASKVVDISSFTIAKKPVMNISNVTNSEIGLAKWVCYSQKSSFLCRSYLGYELEQLRQYTNNARQGEQILSRRSDLSDDDINQVNSEIYRYMMDRYKILYEHIESPKPNTLEAWLMNTTASDIDDIFFNIYISSFKDTNFIPVDCQNQKCNNTILHGGFDIKDMVKFPNDEVEAKFKEIYNSDPIGNPDGILLTELVPISMDIAIGFKQRSVYDEVLKYLLSAQFRRKYSMISDLFSYIDSIYVIDKESRQLIPIGYKKYTNNKVKTLKSKLIKWNDALSTLTSDQFNVIYSYAQELQKLETEERPKYVIPEYTCDKCGHVSPQADATGEMLVFTRSQLAAMTNTSLS